jgi:hypothetical protein
VLIWETSVQERIAPEKLSRVSAYAWVGAMAFLPAGYAITGPVARMIGTSTTLWIGAAWIVVTTAAVLCVPDGRNFRARAPDRDRGRDGNALAVVLQASTRRQASMARS